MFLNVIDFKGGSKLADSSSHFMGRGGRSALLDATSESAGAKCRRG